MRVHAYPALVAVLSAAAAGLFPSALRNLPAQETESRSQEGRAGVGVQGQVVDHETREPIPSAAVSLASGPGGTSGVGTRVTNGEGRFLFRAVPSGSYRLTITMLGYERMVDTLRVSGEADLDLLIPLSVNPVRLDPIVVEVEQRSYDWRGFEERSKDRFQGFTVTREEMDVQRPRVLTDVLASVPGARIGPAPYGGKTLLLRGDCLPSIFLDGARMPNTESIDRLVSANNVEAVEVFHGFDLPVEYGVNPCGGVLIWTRMGEPSQNESGEGFWSRIVLGVGVVLLVIALTR